MIRCVMMTRKWQLNVLQYDPIVCNFRDFGLRCQVAVNMAIGSTKVHDEAKLVVAWIDHRYKHSCAALRAAIILDRRLSFECGKRLLFFFVDFIVLPAWLTIAMSQRLMQTIDRDLLAAP